MLKTSAYRRCLSKGRASTACPTLQRYTVSAGRASGSPKSQLAVCQFMCVPVEASIVGECPHVTLLSRASSARLPHVAACARRVCVAANEEECTQGHNRGVESPSGGTRTASCSHGR